MIKKFLCVITILSVCSTAWAKQPEDSNIAWTKQFYAEVLNKGNIDIIDKLVSENYVEREAIPGFESNRDGLKQFFKMMRTAFPDLNTKIGFMVAENEKIVVYVTMTGTHKGEYMGIPATGKKFDIKVIDIIRVVNGKMMEHWGVGDYMTMMQQLGVIPEETSAK